MQRILRFIVGVALIAVFSWFSPLAIAQERVSGGRPNILWITCEDISPNLGCYGDRYAVTPNLDCFAEESIRYTHAFATAGVCAPSRSTLITGVYASSLGTQLMRCEGKLPPEVRCFPAYLREAGYYCTNNSKTDYNFRAPDDTWDASSNKAHWRNRPKEKPFFAVFNLNSSHESKTRLPEQQFQRLTAKLEPHQRHSPDQAPLPPYHPDTPESRQDWARHYDTITAMDRQVGDILRQLEDDGLADSTIVFFVSDHGAGMPRSKRWLYDSGTRVPLLVRFPAKYQSLSAISPGSTTDRLVSLVDMAPTVLNLTGVVIPEHMQGQAFLGEKAESPRDYIFGHRDRMDERYDLIRSVRDKRYKYIRNYRPDLPYFREQHLEYAFEMPTLKVWQKLANDGKLTGAAATFMSATKPVEELYDTEADPWEVHNLAALPEHRATLERMQKRLREWIIKTIDLGFLPEADLRTRFGETAPFAAVRGASSERLYPFSEILRAAELASINHRSTENNLRDRLGDSDPAVRYWAAVGTGSLRGGKDDHVKSLRTVANKTSEQPIVCAAAAEALCRLGEFETAVPVLADLMASDNEWVRLYSANVLDRQGSKARSAIAAIEKGQSDSNGYVQRICRHAIMMLSAE